MASNGIPFLGRLRQLLRTIFPMLNERTTTVVAPMIVQPTAVQPTAGQTPNIWWKAIGIDQLRSHPSYAALPATPPPLQPSTYRYVRQESSLWSALHSGVITSSTLNGALGFYEPGAAQKLGLPKHFVRHGALLAAYDNLLQPEYIPPSQNGAASASAHHGPLHAAADANSNSSSINGSKTLAQVWVDSASTGTPGARIDAAATIPLGLGPHDRPKRALQNSGAAHHGSTGKSAGNGHRKSVTSKAFHCTSATSVEQEQARQRLKTCEQKAEIGIGSVRCKWGSVQESTALWELMHAVPQGALEEIGLCRVDPAVLRDQYGFPDGRLPPMGASPDGLIRQRQPSHATTAFTALRTAFAGMSVQDSSSSSVLDCEVVEVKNTCPFRQQTGLNKKGKQRSGYFLSDPGPRQRVNQTWVTQLQLEMLAAPAQSALLISRSASKGMTIFRMWRDEAYLQAMLGYHNVATANGAEVVVLLVPPKRIPKATGDLRI